jgi:hypothetical protein
MTESNELAGSVPDLQLSVLDVAYQPVVFLHTQDLTFSQYLAFLIIADAFLVFEGGDGVEDTRVC